MNKQADKLVIDIIGFPGCGKSSVCKLLADAGFTIMRPSDVIRAYAAETQQALTGRADYVRLHHELNSLDPVAIIKPVLASTDTRICLDGMRSPFLLDKLQAEIEHVLVIALDCPIEERYRRVKTDDERAGTHRAPASLEAFRADEVSDYTNPDRNLPNMKEMLKRADYTIDATQTPQQIANQILAIYS